MKGGSWVILSAGGLLALCIYGPRLNAPFVWDDRGTIAFNAALERPIPLKDFFTPEYFKFAAGEYSWRPLSTLSYYAMIRMFGKSPAALRGFSLLLHFLNGILLLAILKAWNFQEEAAAWAVALFWAHPAHVESLMCAAFNKEPLSALGLLAMLAAHQRKRWGLASFGYAAALLAKETGAAGILLAALFDLCDGGTQRFRARLRAYCAYAAVLGLYVFMRFDYAAGPAGQLSLALPFSERLYYAFDGWITAIRVFFLPVALRIEYFALPPESVRDWLLRGGAGIVLAGVFAAAAYYLWEKDRKLSFFCLWPLPFLFITSNLIPAGALNTRMMAERWLYLPYLGWTVVLGTLLTRIVQLHVTPAKARHSLVIPAKAGIHIWTPVFAGVTRWFRGNDGSRWYRMQSLCIATMIWWFLLSNSRAQDWSREPRLWAGLERIYPWSAKAEEGLGEAYFRSHEYPQALAAFKRAQVLRDGRADKILAHYAPIAHGVIDWESPSLYRWLGHCEVALGDLPRARTYFEKALALAPGDGFSYRIMTYAYAAHGDFARAEQWLKRGLAHDPKDDLLLRLKPEIGQKKLRLRVSFDG